MIAWSGVWVVLLHTPYGRGCAVFGGYVGGGGLLVYSLLLMTSRQCGEPMLGGRDPAPRAMYGCCTSKGWSTTDHDRLRVKPDITSVWW